MTGIIAWRYGGDIDYFLSKFRSALEMRGDPTWSGQDEEGGLQGSL